MSWRTNSSRKNNIVRLGSLVRLTDHSRFPSPRLGIVVGTDKRKITQFVSVFWAGKRGNWTGPYDGNIDTAIPLDWVMLDVVMF